MCFGWKTMVTFFTECFFLVQKIVKFGGEFPTKAILTIFSISIWNIKLSKGN